MINTTIVLFVKDLCLIILQTRRKSDRKQGKMSIEIRFTLINSFRYENGTKQI